jgi:Flp pilus assembly protein TadB
MIERSGRTGRREQPDKKAQTAKNTRQTRFDRPPSWRGSLNRAALAAVVFGILVVVVFKQQPVQGVVLAVVMVAVYWPMTFYTDRFIYRRRQKRLAQTDTSSGRTRVRK